MYINTWEKNEYFDSKWELRIKVMSLFIDKKDKKICDIGCGEGKLKKFIPQRSSYIGIDYRERKDVTHVYDLNYEYPPIEIIEDVVFCSGVLEYIYDLKSFAAYLAQYAKKIIFSYCPLEHTSNQEDRKKRGWVNSFTKKEIITLFSIFGMELRHENIIFNNMIFCFDKFTKHPDKNQTKLLIVDPIYRGSRAFYTANALTAGKFNQIDIITRTSALNEHTISFLLNSNSPFNIHEKVEVEDDFWYGKISDENIQNIINSIIELSNIHKYNLIYFVGLNEIYPEIFRKLLKLNNSELLKTNMLFVEYNYNHLISLVANRKYNKLKLKFQENFLATYMHARIAILDERVFDSKWSALEKSEYKNRFIFMPDPAAKLYEKEKNGRNNKIKLLLVGLQSKRKGINNIVRFLKKYENFLKNFEFILVGRLDSESEIHADYLSECSNLKWINDYLEEEKLQEMYEHCDYVMLPYTKDFNGSSGVFAHACAHSKPMISTNHGCIGYRVERFGLGMTFESGNMVQLYNLLQRLDDIKIEEYRQMERNANQYAIQHSIEKHQEIIMRGMNSWK